MIEAVVNMVTANGIHTIVDFSKQYIQYKKHSALDTSRLDKYAI